MIGIGSNSAKKVEREAAATATAVKEAAVEEAAAAATDMLEAVAKKVEKVRWRMQDLWLPRLAHVKEERKRTVSSLKDSSPE